MTVTTPNRDTSKFSQSTSSNILLSSNSNGDQIKLSESTLSAWLKVSIDNVEIMAKYGLQGSSQVISFLHTHSGKVAREMILEELIKIANREELSFKHNNAEQQAHQQLLAYLLIKVAYKENEHFRQLCEEAQIQINKLLNSNKKSSSNNNQDDPVFLLSLLENIDNYRQEITRSLEANKFELTNIEGQLTNFGNIRSSAQQTHRDFGNAFNDLRNVATNLIYYDDVYQINTPNNLADRLTTLQTTVDRADSHLTTMHREIVAREGAAEPIITNSLTMLCQLRETIKDIVIQRTNNNSSNDTITADKPFTPIRFSELAQTIINSSEHFERSRGVYINYYDTHYKHLTNKQSALQKTIHHLEDADEKARKKAQKILKQLSVKHPNFNELNLPKMSLSRSPAFFGVRDDSSRADVFTPRPVRRG